MSRLQPTHPVGVVGSGTMGAGIAQVALLAGHRVLLHDLDPDRAAKAHRDITASLDRLVEKGRLKPWAKLWALDRLQIAPTLEHLAPCALVIEAVAESLAVKQDVFRELEKIVRVEAILATNTSSLSITEIGAALEHPQRLVGMHFFNPAPVLPLVEVVSGLATDPGVAETVYETARAWGKTPVRARSTPGFIVNRIARPFYGEALRAYEEGAADPATIDAVLRECGGFKMGPLELTDLIGQDVNLAVSTSVWEAFHHDPRYAPSLAQRELVAAGWLGRKTGRGFYSYGEGAAKPEPATAPPAPAPEQVVVRGSGGPFRELLRLITDAGIKVKRRSEGTDFAKNPEACEIEVPGRVRLCLTNGHFAGWDPEYGSGLPAIAFDLALDYAAATRIAVAPADAPRQALDAAVGLFQALGKRVTVLPDLPGLLVARTVAMLVNEAADALYRGVAGAADIDTAMRAGVNYPLGPLAWGDRLGARWVTTVLDNLAEVYRDGRYRPSPLLRRMAETGRKFHD
ncbi:3-hydroxyacyl-CoA dehydrogenase PaaC [Carbonactinospora thermoautotrophica]|uniref:3-hydroxyacyl-CoA dehydrogenase PaaC n=1 Tax=Carbonactinospora thermoautotrophica TaxID=1469144 RepID=A0A132MN72_9ACTN|nr:3-hydroxyacyl-CoA dehydrogenase [Carbonactinospora thermoautotrophica]KWW99175.1 3-hydroxyacyl-CoA dehydrogenase PaaC [Carbonactinospora thermoautotrophica]